MATAARIERPTYWYNKFKQTLPRLDGKVICITGTTSGTGYAAAKCCAELGGEVILLNRASERSTKSFAALQEQVPNGKFVPVECDLMSFNSVRKATEEIKSKYTKIYAACANAGIMANDDIATEDGYDIQMQVNHFSHFLLFAELYPLLAKSAEEDGDARIVSMSSGGRNLTPKKTLERRYFEKNGGNLGGNDLKLLAGPNFHRYFQSKLANSVFTHALDDRLKASGSKVRAVCAHPGGSATALGDDEVYKSGGLWGRLVVVPMMNRFMQSAEDGAMGILTGIASPKAVSGELYGPARDWLRGPAVINKAKPYETNKDSKQMLWETSEQACGVKFSV